MRSACNLQKQNKSLDNVRNHPGKRKKEKDLFHLREKSITGKKRDSVEMRQTLGICYLQKSHKGGQQKRRSGGKIQVETTSEAF